MFKNMKLATKICLGFGMVLFILVAVAGLGYNSLRQCTNGFSEYRNLARDNNLAGRLQANMLKARLEVKDFLITGQEADARTFRDNWKKTQELMDQAEKEITETKRTEAIKSCKTDMDQYESAFNTAVTNTLASQKLIDEVVNVKGAQITTGLKELAGVVGKDADANASRALACADEAERAFLTGRVYVNKFFDTEDTKMLDTAKENLAKVAEQLSTLNQIVKNSDNLKMIATINEAKAIYDQNLDKVAQTMAERKKVIQATLDPTGAKFAQTCEDLKLSIKDEQDKLGPMLQAANARSITIIVILSISGLIMGVLIAIFITRAITKPINRIIAGLTEGSEQVAAASGQVSAASQSLAEGATEQAAGLEETSSSLEEMSSMTKQNADNAQQANTLAAEAKKAAGTGAESMSRMNAAIVEIQKSSDETAKIIKVIDEIAFQTNLLALNAAVEAARAGEAGKGFAVVAEEVRNLAMRSAEAAKNTARMIEESVKNSKNGVDIATEVSKVLEEIVQSVGKTTDLVSEIAAASQEQAQGIDQVNTAVAQMDKVTQQNAANAEESASASEELSAQAESMKEVVSQLVALVGGAAGSQGHTSGPKKTEHHLNLKLEHKPAKLEKTAAKSHSLGKSDETFHKIAHAAPSKHASAATAKTASQAIPLDGSEHELENFNN